MALIAAPESLVSYPISVDTRPAPAPVGEPTELRLRVHRPEGDGDVREFVAVHEKLLHLFIVSEDLSHFEHLHPTLSDDGTFVVRARFPAKGRYQVIADFVPRGGMPQLTERTIFTARYRAPLQTTHLAAGSSRRFATQGRSVTLDANELAAGRPILLVARVDGAPLEPYLGAWAHILVVSEDLVDVAHAHADREGNTLRFELTLPRAGSYRAWLQVQLGGEVITAPFVLTARRPEARFLEPATP
jgi:hypothetical protein